MSLYATHQRCKNYLILLLSFRCRFHLTKFPGQSKQRLLHRPMHDDGYPVESRKLLPRCAAGDSPVPSWFGEPCSAYHETHSQDNPSDRHGTRLSDSFHQTGCCGPPVTDLLSKVLSLIHISEPTRLRYVSRMPSSA